MKLNLWNAVEMLSYIEISGTNTWVRENLNTDIQFLKNLWKYTLFIRIKTGLKYTQGLKYMPGSAAEWKK